MNEFRKYNHLERLGHPEVRDIERGLVYIFPKIDGTNACVWADDEVPGKICAGSRNRQLTAEKDNHGFHAWAISDDPKATALRAWLRVNPTYIAYGEWMVPHSLKTYRQDVWRRFWIFDVYDRKTNRYVPYDLYMQDLKDLSLDFIRPLCTATDPATEQLHTIADQNTFLIQEGAGAGEGIVLKNYKWFNQFDRQTWAKLVRAEKHTEASRPATDTCALQIEQEAVLQFATEAFIRKEFDKVVAFVAGDFDEDLTDTQTQAMFILGNRSKIIPRFLGTLWHEFVKEEMWSILKKWKNPRIDFALLNRFLVLRAKAVMKEVFGG